MLTQDPTHPEGPSSADRPALAARQDTTPRPSASDPRPRAEAVAATDGPSLVGPGPAAAPSLAVVIPTISDAVGQPRAITLVPAGLAYCRGRLKRSFDIGFTLVALIVLLPVFLLVSLALLLTSTGPVFFSQERVGMDGRFFRLWKFRSMRVGSEKGPLITARGDRRITLVGRILRVTKLDELPQFYNVLKGDMSIVGPRPLIPRYYMSYTPEQRRVLEVRPGLTDPATLLFRDEESILVEVAEDEREKFYKTVLLQRKLALNLAYLEEADLLCDFTLVLRTAVAVAFRTRRKTSRGAAAARVPEF